MIEYGNGMVLPTEQFIVRGDHHPSWSGPYPSQEAADAAYRTNQPTGLAYLSPPEIVRLLRPLDRELGGRAEEQQPMSEFEYTTRPTRVRVFDEGPGWAIDGIDDAGGYTEAVWTHYDDAELTRETAILRASEFAREHGIPFDEDVDPYVVPDGVDVERPLPVEVRWRIVKTGDPEFYQSFETEEAANYHCNSLCRHADSVVAYYVEREVRPAIMDAVIVDDDEEATCGKTVQKILTGETLVCVLRPHLRSSPHRAADGTSWIEGVREEGLAATARPGLFRSGSFHLHSGSTAGFMIDCDALTRDDLAALAAQVAARLRWRAVRSVPTGGDRFAEALRRYCVDVAELPVLIVDDVWTTGRSMIEAYEANKDVTGGIRGVVIFARSETAPWVTALFQFQDLGMPF